MIPYRITQASLDALASPSLSMEKGTYRLRAPKGRPDARRAVSRPQNSNPAGMTACTVLLVVFLAMAALSSFGTAYYLLKTRWDTRVVPLALASKTNQEIQANRFESNFKLNVTLNYSDEKFLSYLPHSGFHNQRIAFENALVLSRILNRTLLVPPIRLGTKPFHYDRFDVLRKRLAFEKVNSHHCSNVSVNRLILLPECFDSINLPWEPLVDLSQVRSHQHLLQRPNMTPQWIWHHLRIRDADIFTIADFHLYQYRFLDTPLGASPLTHKFRETIDIPQLNQHPERLLQLGTLFGNSRLRLRQAENIRIRGEIRRSMAFADPHLVQAADAIARRLGGAYLGVHLRLGDGHFKVSSHANARLVWWKLVHLVLKVPVNEALALERLLPNARSPGAILQPPWVSDALTTVGTPIPLPPDDLPSLLSCRGQKHASTWLKPLNTPLFISTDAKHAFKDPTIAVFLDTFPCTFFLSDFTSLRTSLGKLQDGVLMDDQFLPFLDAMVVGKAWAVVGTEGSTFSRFVLDVLWRTYHGKEILQRG